MQRPVVRTPRITVTWWPADGSARAARGWLAALFAIALITRAVPPGSAPIMLAAAALALVGLARLGNRVALALGAFLALWSLPAAFPLLAGWPMRWAVPVMFGLWALGRPAMGRLRPGLAVAAGAAATLAMVGWALVGGADGGSLRAGLTGYGPLALVGLALVFSALNAPLEELAWRGLLLGGLERLGIPAWRAISLQALGFGAFEAWGEPSGWSGLILGTAFGLILGVLRLKGGGLATPIAAHFLADLAIVAAVLSQEGP